MDAEAEVVLGMGGGLIPRLGLLLALCLISPDHAAAVGVPALGPAPADYVGYAVDELPSHFLTPAMDALDNTPVANPITNEGAELGRVLFYDARLSHNNATACASCHSQEVGFTDTAQFSAGFEGGLTARHSMGLSNARWYKNSAGEGRFFWDERAATLEDQVLGPIQDAVEMGSDLTDLVGELADTEFYPVLFQRAFGDSEITSERMSFALAQFVRSMASYQSPYDTAVAAGAPREPDFSALGLAAADEAQLEEGHQLFMTNCAGCHTEDAQVSDDPHNIGLPYIDADGDGTIDIDRGAGSLRFKTPSLRNSALRGRYMHDGRFSSLEEVIEFYSTGVVDNGAVLGPGMVVGGFNYTHEEKAALVAFLESLTDAEFLTSELFSNPLVTLAGDYDGSGVVDDADRAAWAAAYGQTEADVSGPLMADGNGDGVVDAADYTLWRQNLGARWDDLLAALSHAVPEPTAAALLLLLSAGGVAARPRC